MTSYKITSVLQKTWAYSARVAYDSGRLREGCRAIVKISIKEQHSDPTGSVLIDAWGGEKLGDLPPMDLHKFLNFTSSKTSSVECVIAKLTPFKEDFFILVDIIVSDEAHVLKSVEAQCLSIKGSTYQQTKVATRASDSSLEFSKEVKKENVAINNTIDNEAVGFVYIIDNPSLQGLLKVGFTLRHPNERAKELASTGVPTPFGVVYYATVDNPQRVETKTHHRLAPYGAGKEWFKATIQECIIAIRAESTVIYKEFFSSRVPMLALNEHETKLRKEKEEKEGRLASLKSQLRGYRGQHEDIANFFTHQQEYIKEKKRGTTKIAFFWVIFGVTALNAAFKDANFTGLLLPSFFIFILIMGIASTFDDWRMKSWQREFQRSYGRAYDNDMEYKINIAIQQTEEAIKKLEKQNR